MSQLPGKKTSSAPFAGNRGSAPNPTNQKAPTLPGMNAGSSGFFSDVDFDNVETSLDLPEGAFEVYIYDVRESLTRNQNPQLELRYKVLEGEYEGRSGIYWLVKTPNTHWKLKQLLMSAHFTESEMSTLRPNDLRGCQFLAILGYDAGQTFTRIRTQDLKESIAYPGGRVDV